MKDHLNLCHKGTLLKGPEPQHVIMKLVYLLICSAKTQTNGNIAKFSSSSITNESTATMYMKRNICRNNVILTFIFLLTTQNDRPTSMNCSSASACEHIEVTFH